MFRLLKKIGRYNIKGQSMAEYLILFSVVVAVIIFAVTAYVKPAVNGLYGKSAVAINQINPTLISGM